MITHDKNINKLLDVLHDMRTDDNLPVKTRLNLSYLMGGIVASLAESGEETAILREELMLYLKNFLETEL